MTQTELDPTFLAEQFFAAAQRRAQSYGVTLGQGADHDIRQFAVTGAGRILLQPDGSVRDAEIQSALKAFERLVDEMFAASREIPGYAVSNPGVIGEQTLARALAKLCPLFPIC